VKTVANLPAVRARDREIELWRVGGDSESEEDLFGVISDIDIDATGEVYLLDSQLSEVKVYSKDGEYLRSLGREGEGPGEFRRPAAMFFTDDGKVAVVQMMPGKIVLLSRTANPRVTSRCRPLRTAASSSCRAPTRAVATSGSSWAARSSTRRR
jgi:hypothetical protein